MASNQQVASNLLIGGWSIVSAAPASPPLPQYFMSKETWSAYPELCRLVILKTAGNLKNVDTWNWTDFRETKNHLKLPTSCYFSLPASPSSYLFSLSYFSFPRSFNFSHRLPTRFRFLLFLPLILLCFLSLLLFATFPLLFLVWSFFSVSSTFLSPSHPLSVFTSFVFFSNLSAFLFFFLSLVFLSLHLLLLLVLLFTFCLSRPSFFFPFLYQICFSSSSFLLLFPLMYVVDIFPKLSPFHC